MSGSPTILIFSKSKMILLVLALILLVLYLLPIYREPRVIPNFLTEDERKHIMEKAKTKLDVSTIAENRVVDKKVRDSETAWLDFTDPVVMRVARRCASLTDRPIMNCETSPSSSLQTGWSL